MLRWLSLLIIMILPVGPSFGWGGAQLDLSGPWAQLQVTSSLSNVPLIGTVTLKTLTVLRLEAQQKGSELAVLFEPCTVESESSTPFFRVIFPEAFVKSMGVATKPARLEGDGFRFFQPRFTQVRGVRLQDPEKDPLPTDPNDPRIFDQDDDGKPGMTIRVNVLGFLEGEIYIIQRDWNSLRSTVLTPTILDGLIEWGSDQVVIGASNPLLNSQSENLPDPKPENSYFRTTRLDTKTDCAQILRDRDKLFAR
jgi:hypothetical protein